MNLKKEHAIENTLTHFDWDKVLKTMNALDWKWATSNGLETPSIYDIRIWAIRLLYDAWESAEKHKNDTYISTGGFRASSCYDKENDEVCSLKLEFIVTNWEESAPLID